MESTSDSSHLGVNNDEGATPLTPDKKFPTFNLDGDESGDNREEDGGSKANPSTVATAERIRKMEHTNNGIVERN